MEYVAEWIATMRADVADLLGQIIAYLPRLLAGILLLVIGWLVARVLRAVASHMIKGWDWLIPRLTMGRAVDHAKMRETSASLVGIAVYWLTILFFVTAAAQALDLEAFSNWLSGAIRYLPQLISGALVIVVGIALGNLARNAIIRSARSVGERQRGLLGPGRPSSDDRDHVRHRSRPHWRGHVRGRYRRRGRRGDVFRRRRACLRAGGANHGQQRDRRALRATRLPGRRRHPGGRCSGTDAAAHPLEPSCWKPTKGARRCRENCSPKTVP